MAGGALALLRRRGRPGREGGRRRDAPRGRRGRRRDGGAAAGAQARRDPRARGRRARPPTRRGRAADLGRGGQADEGRPRRGKPCDVDVHVLRGRGTEARRRDDPDGRVAGRRGKARVHAPPPARRGRRDQPVQLPAQPRRPQDRSVAGGGLRSRPQARGPDAALGAAPGRARGRGRTSARVAERRRRPFVGDRRRPRRGRSREGDHVHRLERRRLEARRALAAGSASTSSSATRRR